MFYNCSYLQNVALNEKLTTIHTNAFDGCTALKSIIIPSNVTLIEANAFKGTTLEKVVFKDINTWRIYSENNVEISNIDYSELSNEETAAQWLTNVYLTRIWINSKADKT